MKKRSTRLVTGVKTKLKVQFKLRQVAVAGAFAFGIFSVALLYNTLGTSTDSIANNKFNGKETLAEYKFRKQISISQEMLPGNENLHDFPIMVSLQDNDLKSVTNGGKMISDKANDIRFTKSDGISLLDYEIEKYDPATGELVAWVKMDSLSKKTEPFFLYFSNKFASDESTQNAWNKTYKGVWHLKGILSRKTPFSNQLAQEPAEKEIYVAAEKNSSQFPCLNTPEDVDITGELSVSAWVYLTDKKECTILSNQSGFNGGYRLAIGKDRKVAFEVRNEKSEPATITGEIGGTTLEKNKWYHVAAVYSDGGDSMTTYVNGQYDRGQKTKISLAGSSDPLQIGREPNRKIYYFGGALEEVHVSNIVRKQEWFATEYVSQGSEKQFLRIGTTEAIEQQISMSLLTFDAEVVGGGVELKWLTIMEIENDLFTIERSTDGTNFQAIGTKPGAGNSNDLLSYRFRDSKPVEGTNYYRIRLTSSTGAEEFSMVTPVNVEAAGQQAINIGSVQPNPFLKDFEVEYTVPKEGTAKIKLMSLKGDVLHEEDVACEAEKSQLFRFSDDKGLKPGVYFLNVTQADESKMIKLIKRI